MEIGKQAQRTPGQYGQQSPGNSYLTAFSCAGQDARLRWRREV